MKLRTPHRLELEIASQEALRTLCGARAELRVSIHLAVPRHPGPDEVRTLPARYEHAVEAAEERLAALGVAPAERRAWIEPLRGAALEFAALPPLARGVAIFGSRDGVRAFALPLGVTESVRVSHGLHLRPLFAAARLESGFRVLALAADRVALFEGDAHGLYRVDLDDVPDPGTTREDEQASALHADTAPADGGALVFSRALVGPRFQERLAARVGRVWAGREDPLVLAADASQEPRFRRVAAPRSLVLGGMVDPLRLRVADLFERARARIFEERVATDRRTAERAAEALSRGAAVGTLETAVAAAIAGRVLRLWLTPDTREPRHVERDTGRLVPARGDDDALDELGDVVVARGGYVLVDASLATGRDVLAELRS